LQLPVLLPTRKVTENDYNRALEKTAPFQDHLERRINNATRWRDDAYGLLEMHRVGYGREVQATTDKILDAEFKEVNDSPVNQMSGQSETEGNATTGTIPETTTEIAPETTTTEIVPEGTTETETIPELPTETNLQPLDNAALSIVPADSETGHDVEPENCGESAQ
jgi:hypothetical protein